MATSDDLMDIDGPSYLEPNIAISPAAAATTPQQQPSPVLSSARKRSHEEYAADDYQPQQNIRYIYTGYSDEPPRRFEGKAFRIFYYVLDVFSYLLTKVYSKKINTVETGEAGSYKRRAIEEEVTPRKAAVAAIRKSVAKSTLPGTFPVTPAKAEPKESAITRHDSIMDDSSSNTSNSAPENADAEETSPLSQRNWKKNKDTSTSTEPNTTTTNSNTSTQQAAPAEGNNDTSTQSKNTITHEAPTKPNPAAFLTYSRFGGQDGKKVIRRLPRPTLADLPPTPSKKASPDKDDEIDQLIKKTKNAVLRDHKAESRFSTSRPQRRFLSSTQSKDFRSLSGAQSHRLLKEAEAAKKLAAEQTAKNEAEKAKLKASAEAIELQLQEEAAKQAAKIEEEKQAEALRKALEEKARLSDPEYIKKQQIIRPLDPEWDDKVDESMATKARHHVITKTVEGAELTRKDFGTLLPQEGTEDNPNGWLNDEIVNGWMAAIVDRKQTQTGYVRSAKNVPAFATMSSAWYSSYQQGGIKKIERWSQRKGIKGEKLLKCEKIFFPINTGAHWLLLIISPKERKLELLDSLNGSGRRWFAIAREWLQMELGDKYDPKEWKEAPSRSSHQLNSNDCGVFTCFNALASAKAVEYEQVKGDQMDEARRMVGAVFLNGGFFGDYEL